MKIPGGYDMKKAYGLFAVLFITVILVFCGCTDSGSGKAAPTPETTKNGNSTMLIATPVVTEKPADPTATGSVVKYTDLITGNENLFFSASSTEATGTADELKPDYCFDGDLETRWSSRFYDTEEGWICVEFGYPVVINGIYLNENTTWGYVTEWDAQYYSESQQKWVAVYEGVETYPDEYYEFEKNTEETYKFRLMFYGCTGLAVTFNEIEVMGLFAEVEDGTPVRTPKPPEGQTIPDGLRNVAMNQTYAASSTENEGSDTALVPAFCFDDNNETRWSTVFGDLYDSWISVDFQSAVTISGFVVNEVKNWGAVTSYSAQIWENNDWKTVYEGETFSEVLDTYVPLENEVTTTKFRLLFHDGQTLSETVSISEIRIYGK